MLKISDRPLYSPKQVAALTKYMQDKVALVHRLQKKGILPCFKPAPKYIVEINDIMRITGKCERTAQRHMKKIREKLGKTNGEYVSIDEYIQESKIPKDTVYMAMYLIPDKWPEGY
jgi:hypothetical protein